MLQSLIRRARFQVRFLRHAAALIGATDPIKSYEQLGDDLVVSKTEGFSDGTKPLWLNLGYWKEARNYPDACRAMALHLGELAGLNNETEVLDVGYGFGEQDLLWVESFDVPRIVGLNITPLHVQVARDRVERRELSERIDLRLGSATDMPIEDASFDRVTGLECAFHFQSREDFFREAFRVLRPGGRLATADIIASPGERVSGPLATRIARVGRRVIFVPEDNLYDRHGYAERLRRAGFTNVEVRSSRYVFPGMSRYLNARVGSGGDIRMHVEVPEEAFDKREGVELWSWMGLSDYVFATADKPA